MDATTVNQQVEGGVLVSEGTYDKADGTTGKTGQFDFNENQFHREFEDRIEIPEEFQHLPDARNGRKRSRACPSTFLPTGIGSLKISA